MAEQPAHMVLCVHNTFFDVKDVNEQARKMTRSKSDSSLSSRVQSDDEQYPMVEVGKGHLSSGWVTCSSGGDSSGNEDVATVSARPTKSGCAWKPTQSAAACSADTLPVAHHADALPVAHDADGIEANEDEEQQQQPSAMGYTRVAWSKGSELHSSGKCKPCAWNWKPNGCSDGVNCQRCHLCEDTAYKNRTGQRTNRIKRKTPSQKACPQYPPGNLLSHPPGNWGPPTADPAKG